MVEEEMTEADRSTNEAQRVVEETVERHRLRCHSQLAMSSKERPHRRPHHRPMQADAISGEGGSQGA